MELYLKNLKIFFRKNLTIGENMPILYFMQKTTLFIHTLCSRCESAIRGFVTSAIDVTMKSQIKNIK